MADLDSRPTIDETMYQVAIVMSHRATCQIRKVGCVIIDVDGIIMSTGYNGQPRGMEHCTDLYPCVAYNNKLASCLAIHAEINAIMRCPDITKIHKVYVTAKPCFKCTLAIANTYCKYIVYPADSGVVYHASTWELLNGYANPKSLGDLG